MPNRPKSVPYPRGEWLPAGKPVGVDVTSRCCARCKTPYGHSAQAGQCCHPRTGENR